VVPVPAMDDLADRLYSRRRELGLTQAQLAERLEVSERTVQLWETRQRRPQKRARERIEAWLAASTPRGVMQLREPGIAYSPTPLGDRVRTLRRTIGITQADLAEVLGRSVQEVDDVEAGDLEPRAADWPELHHWLAGDAIALRIGGRWALGFPRPIDPSDVSSSVDLQQALADGALVPYRTASGAWRLMPVIGSPEPDRAIADVDKLAEVPAGSRETQGLSTGSPQESSRDGLTSAPGLPSNALDMESIARRVHDTSPVPGGRVRVEVHLSKPQLEKLDRFAFKQRQSRSRALRALLGEVLDQIPEDSLDPDTG